MTDQTTSHTTCLNCGRSEMELPLAVWRFRGVDFSICPLCMPALIHKHQELLAHWQATGLFQPSVPEIKGD